MIRKKKIYTMLFNLYAFLFIFTMINREFVPFGFDLRMISLPLGVILLVMKILNDKKIYYDREDSLGNSLILFYSMIFLCMISFTWNNLSINKEKLLNECILIINVFVGIIVFYYNKKNVIKEKIYLYVVISTVILSLSIVLVHQGIEFKKIMGSEDVKYIYESINDVEQKNIFGEDFRTAGYASDPNYATMLLIIGIICTLKSKVIKKLLKIICITLFCYSIGLSFSKTIVLATLIILIYLEFIKIVKVKHSTIKILNTFFIFMVLFVIMILPHLNNFIELPQTLTTRFFMWDKANELFLNSPIIGNGLTSFRNYFKLNGGWYVQAHSTYWQIISELGIVGILIYLRILKKSLDISIDQKYDYFLKLVFIIWIITCESIALPFSIFVLYINSLNSEKKKYDKKALFFINTLSNGGAERVCINLANELIQQKYKVDFILLSCHNDKNSYELNDNIKIYNLKINTSNKIKKMFLIFISIFKVNNIIEKNEEFAKYELITSHLPMSNIVTRLSNVKNRAIYVFHTTIKSYDNIGSKLLFKILLDFMYKNKKVVTVSEGLRNEAINNYKFNKKKVKTIYNPIIFSEIERLKKEEIDIKDPYFILIGRFNKAKRQDRMLDVFYKGEFYKKYKMVFCGNGELEEDVKKQAIELGIEDRIIFKGWQSNVYKWIKNSELLISTSDYEAFPMNLIEAFACNTKVVSSDCDFGPREILLGEYSKYLVKTNEINDYIKKINNALEDYPDEENEILEKCKSKNIIKEYIEFMKEEDKQ